MSSLGYCYHFLLRKVWIWNGFRPFTACFSLLLPNYGQISRQSRHRLSTAIDDAIKIPWLIGPNAKTGTHQSKVESRVTVQLWLLISKTSIIGLYKMNLYAIKMKEGQDKDIAHIQRQDCGHSFPGWTKSAFPWCGHMSEWCYLFIIHLLTIFHFPCLYFRLGYYTKTTRKWMEKWPPCHRVRSWEMPPTRLAAVPPRSSSHSRHQLIFTPGPFFSSVSPGISPMPRCMTTWTHTVVCYSSPTDRRSTPDSPDSASAVKWPIQN